jgi:hypothetical protein
LLPTGFPANFDEGCIPARSDRWPHYTADILVRGSQIVSPVTARSGWSSKRLCQEFIDGGFQPIVDSKGQLSRFVITRTGAIEAVKVRTENQSHVVSVIRGVGSTQSTSEDLAKAGVSFRYPKPVGLISYLISMVADKNAIVLDSFAGSGTTAHAVLVANERDQGNRRFILVQLPYESDDQQAAGFRISERITAKRVRVAIEGLTGGEGELVQGMGGGFRYCTLGPTLFDASGRIREDVSFKELARHIFFTETGQPLPEDALNGTPLLGTVNGTAVYLLYNGILKDRRPDGGNALTREVLTTLPPHEGPKIVYGTSRRMSRDTLRRLGVTFRQTPYEIRTR